MSLSAVDSLRQLLVGHEVLTRGLQSRLDTLTLRVDSLVSAAPDTVRDTIWAGFVDHRQHGLGIEPKDIIGWLVTGLSIGVAATVAIRGWKANSASALRAVERRREIEEEWRRARLILRIRSGLEMASTQMKKMLEQDLVRPISSDGMKVVRTIWDRYDRVSDDLGLLGDPEMEEAVDEALMAAGALAARVLGEEEQFRQTRRELGKPTDVGIEIHPSVERGIQEHRGKLFTMIRSIETACSSVLQRFNSTFPPASWHSATSTSIELSASDAADS